MLIVNGVVHTMDTGVIPLGFVLEIGRASCRERVFYSV